MKKRFVLMRKDVLCLLITMVPHLMLKGCANGGQEQAVTESGIDSVDVETAAEEPALPQTAEMTGCVVDEMMSTVTLATENGDTVTFVKGEDFTSDAAIGDEVVITLDTENEEHEITNVRKL